MAFTQITVVQDYTLADGTEPSGSLTFTPSAPMLNSSAVVPPVPAVARLVGDGSISTTLTANTDPGTTPTGSYYNVAEMINGHLRNFKIRVPHDGGSPRTLYDLVVSS
jgi:hypothetical protein